jgi:ferredoxin
MSADQQAPEDFGVTFRSAAGRTVRCRTDQFVLEAGEDAGIPLSYGCREGACGTCKSKLLSGQVRMEHNGGIRQREIDAGYILLCCSIPLSDLLIE